MDPEKYVSPHHQCMASTNESGKQSLFLRIFYEDHEFEEHADHEFFPPERDKWNPNDPKIFERERTAEWLKETWEKYVHTKYKAALNRWNRDTGGGNGHLWDFADYCSHGDVWLVWVFC